MARIDIEWPDDGDVNWADQMNDGLTAMVDLLNEHDDALSATVTGGTSAGGFTITDNGDGTITVTPS